MIARNSIFFLKKETQRQIPPNKKKQPEVLKVVAPGGAGLRGREEWGRRLLVFIFRHVEKSLTFKRGHIFTLTKYNLKR